MKLKLRQQREKEGIKGKVGIESFTGIVMSNSQYSKLPDVLEKSETKVTEKSSSCGSDSIDSTRMSNDEVNSSIQIEEAPMNEFKTNDERNETNNDQPEREPSILGTKMDEFVAELNSDEADYTESEYTYDDETYTVYTRDDRTDYDTCAEETYYTIELPKCCDWDFCMFFTQDPDYVFVKQYVSP